jgi:hypothetical protein
MIVGAMASFCAIRDRSNTFGGVLWLGVGFSSTDDFSWPLMLDE